MSRNNKDDLTKKLINSFHKIAANIKLVHIPPTEQKSNMSKSDSVTNISTVQEKITPA